MPNTPFDFDADVFGASPGLTRNAFDVMTPWEFGARINGKEVKAALFRNERQGNG
ncbi:hypothetical protein NKG99_14365 [Mesorhizobium sp. M1409]|uniref:hypothetical protein n=1 Tax=unclassified Mesorhizobium TaxID=325217 RepID=UPI00333E0361